VDWFWEIAGLGAPAFALLGLACALAPQTQRSPDAVTVQTRGQGAARVASHRLPVSVWVLLALASAASLTTEWLR
jgi:hypothetical protein